MGSRSLSTLSSPRCASCASTPTRSWASTPTRNAQLSCLQQNVSYKHVEPTAPIQSLEDRLLRDYQQATAPFQQVLASVVGSRAVQEQIKAALLPQGLQGMAFIAAE